MLPFLATYRVQLNAEFPLARAAEVVPYLERLGVSHLYASPILAARPGSTHGYDVVDPARVNPELGGDEARRALAARLRERGMGLLLDIVPNHMSASAANPYWEDVLARGRASRWAHWFDVDWESPDPAFRGRVMLPVLGDYLPDVLGRGELRVVDADGAFRLAYFEHSFPLAPESERMIMRAALPGASRAEAAQGFAEGAGGRARMQALLRRQHYRPTYWRRAAREINYRRFFDINELVALRAEDARVFEETHRLALAWVADGTVQGLRVDHVDGILDPLAYLRRLRAAVRGGRPAGDEGDVPVFVEKILSPGEQLRDEWPVQGTTGYEVLNDIDTLFMDPAGVRSIERTYRALLPAARRARDFHQVAHEGKVYVLRGSLEADARRLARLLRPIARADARTAALDEEDLQHAVVALIAALAVYRTYVDERGASDEDRRLVEAAAMEARERGEAPRDAIDLLEEVLLLRGATGEERARRLAFARRFEQVSGPATAKGVEDTALYRYAPLVSRNEVGGDPTRPLADAPALVHEANARRRARWPLALTCTNTHDTKRGADVRARVNVLTELPDAWRDCVVRWTRAHRDFKTRLGRRRAPDIYSEYLLYQTVVGAWPLRATAADMGEFAARITAYMLKAVRESKSRTSWAEGDEAFERALAEFVDALLLGDRGRQFRDDVAELVARVARPGLWGALSRVLVHLAAPGTPDLYQGDELWSFTLVDPDNRRPVDYALRARLLAEAERGAALDAPARAAFLAELLATPEDGRVKLYLTHRLLQARRRWPALFRDGSYEPVTADGAQGARLFAFLRRDGERVLLAVAPRLVSGLAAGGAAPTGAVWAETRLRLPAELGGARWECALSGRTVSGAAAAAGGAALLAADALATFPVALLTAELTSG